MEGPLAAQAAATGDLGAAARVCGSGGDKQDGVEVRTAPSSARGDVEVRLARVEEELAGIQLWLRDFNPVRASSLEEALARERTSREAHVDAAASQLRGSLGEALQQVERSLSERDLARQAHAERMEASLQGLLRRVDESLASGAAELCDAALENLLRRADETLLRGVAKFAAGGIADAPKAGVASTAPSAAAPLVAAAQPAAQPPQPAAAQPAQPPASGVTRMWSSAAAAQQHLQGVLTAGVLTPGKPGISTAGVLTPGKPHVVRAHSPAGTPSSSVPAPGRRAVPPTSSRHHVQGVVRTPTPRTAPLIAVTPPQELMGLTPVRHDILRTPSRQASYAPSRGPVLPGGDAPLGFSMADALGDGGWQRGLPCSAARGRATIATVVSAGGAPRTVSPVGRGAASPRSPRSLAQPPAARQLAPGSAHAPP